MVEYSSITRRKTLTLRRSIPNLALFLFCSASTLIGVLFLALILLLLIVKGMGVFSFAMLTHPTPGPNSQPTGMANAILGSIVVTSMGIVVAIPIGVMAATYMAEYGKPYRHTKVIRFVNDVLLSVPSILVGLFVYQVLVRPMGNYSGWAGGAALAIIAIPIIMRTSEDAMQLVPSTLKEAGAALGIPRSIVIRAITWRCARASIFNGIVLAFTRIAGETAPLLFTMLNSNSWFNYNLIGGIPNLPVTIWQFALSPYENWQNIAWAGALLITLFILTLSIIGRLIFRKESLY